jgi:NDP-sugar pyrophosphorylase family protein
LKVDKIDSKRNNFQAAILAGGLGKRLRPVVNDRNKVAADVDGRPFIMKLLEQLHAADVHDVVICCGYKADDLMARVGPRYKSIDLQYSREQTQLGTAGALRLALPFFSAHDVVVMNGDSYCDVNVGTLCRHHHATHAVATLTAVPMADVARYGTIVLDSSDRVTAFMEKKAGVGSGYINGGVYVIDRAMIATIPEAVAVSLEAEMFPRWIAKGIHAMRHNGTFIDIGTPDSLALARSLFADSAMVAAE